MMIRLREGKHTSTVLLIRVSWNGERQRSIQKVLGSFQSSVQELPEELAGPESALTEVEKAEAREWIQRHQSQLKIYMLPDLGPKIVRDLTELAQALDTPDLVQSALSELDHVALYEALDGLQKSLRKHSLTRPVLQKQPARA